ncbi:DegT/DnrJ/EryC1/StrS family aminotransferase [Spirillospora sp. CA-294931]|uniref:DegT/DnrJ/EryC1/StrS family aminotransferase n=1 Tax=Spirillospora sp. CA-294931 TaxID=3240042 RepID=UPI003D8B99D3
MPELPMFDEPLHVGRPNIGDPGELRKRIDDALTSRWLTAGPMVKEFEERIAELAGTAHCVATCNATVGIQLAARACGIEPGDEVIMPAFTWVATAHALSWIGVVPVFCDVDEESANLVPEAVEKVITPATRGILGVHVFGRPCPAGPLAELADRYDVPLLFDAAHAIGSTYRGRPLGGFGAAEVFSFHATKFLNSFEGGAVVTDDADLAATVRAMRNFGITEDGTVATVGTNAKMTEGAAAMGLTSLGVMETVMDANRVNHECYTEGLAGVPGVVVRSQEPGERANHQYLVIEIDASVAGVHRDRVHEVLGRQNVLSRRYFYPACHQVEPYRSNPERHAPQSLPNSEALADRVLALPTGPTIGASDIADICTIIRLTVEAAGDPAPHGTTTG